MCNYFVRYFLRCVSTWHNLQSESENILKIISNYPIMEIEFPMHCGPNTENSTESFSRDNDGRKLKPKGWLE